jgi:predicted transcriptional regulator
MKMPVFNKTETMEKKGEYLKLMSEYFDAMIELDEYKGAEIMKKIYELLPVNLLIDYNVDVDTTLKTGKNKVFYEKMKAEYNKLAEEE